MANISYKTSLFSTFHTFSGPFTVAENGKRVLVGVVSFGSSQCGAEEGGSPSGFARVTTYLEWIKANTGTEKVCSNY